MRFINRKSENLFAGSYLHSGIWKQRRPVLLAGISGHGTEDKQAKWRRQNNLHDGFPRLSPVQSVRP